MTPFSFQLTCCAKSLCNPLLKSWTKLRSRPIGVAESHVTMKRNDGLDLFASLKQWWLCIACQLWRHLFIASTAFQRKWNSRPAQWCRPWLPHDSWLPLLRFNDSNGKAFQYQVSVSRGKLCMPCSQASAAQSLACLRRCHGRIGWAGQPGGKKTCKLKWYAVSCYMICHDLLLLHAVPFMLKLGFTKHPVCWTQAKLPRDSPKRCSEPPLIKLSFNGAQLGLEGESVGCKGRQRKIRVLGIFFFSGNRFSPKHGVKICMVNGGSYT